MSEAEINILINNKKGLHARAAAKFVRTVEVFNVKVMVAKIAGKAVVEGAEPVEASGCSILGLMMLGCECGSTIRARFIGEQTEEASQAIKILIEDKFGEE
ncbi:MAG: HPr family phosphocarrier protein [Pseudomonadota bacterium]